MRLRQSLRWFHWPEPKWERVYHGASQLAPYYPVLRITIFPDGREWITGRSLPQNLHQWQKEGVHAWVAPRDWGRSLPHHKTGNYLTCWLALQTAQQMGCQEAILVDDQGNWLETSTGNLWGWYDNCWWTPPLTARSPDVATHLSDEPSTELSSIPSDKSSGTPSVESLRRESGRILPGVARSHLISALKWHNRQIQESVWSMDLVSRFETLFYTNSVRYVVAIAHVHQSSSPQNYEKGEARNYPVNHPSLQGILELFCSIPSANSTRGF